MRPHDAIERALRANDTTLLLQQIGTPGRETERNRKGIGTNPELAPAGSLNTRRLSDIVPTPISWLWQDRIARGKLSIIAGDPGLGKSTITANIAAVVTTGGRWPVDRKECTPGDVLFLSAEDDPADTLRPRLEAAGADLRRIHFVDGVVAGYTADGSQANRFFSLAEDMRALDLKLADLPDAAVVVIDPISAYLGSTDSHKNAEIRGLLAPLTEVAARRNVAIIGISHLNKDQHKQSLMRITGSLAFVAAARAVYMVLADPQDKMRRLFLPAKNNLGPDSSGLAFRIESASISCGAGPLATSRVVWESEPVPLTADEAMQSGTASRASALDEAVVWLRETLSACPVPAGTVDQMREEKGISKKTLDRAAGALNIEKKKQGMASGWSWSLPPKLAKFGEDAQGSKVTTFGEVDYLREPGGQMAEVEL